MTESRKEIRIRAAQPGNRTTLKWSASATLDASIIDISRSGLQLEVDKPVAAGARIELQLKELIVFGRVRRCRLENVGLYRIGIVIDQVIDSGRSSHAASRPGNLYDTV